MPAGQNPPIPVSLPQRSLVVRMVSERGMPVKERYRGREGETQGLWRGKGEHGQTWHMPFFSGGPTCCMPARMFVSCSQNEYAQLVATFALTQLNERNALQRRAQLALAADDEECPLNPAPALFPLDLTEDSGECKALVARLSQRIHMHEGVDTQHTDTHTHTHTQARTHTHTHTHIRAHTHARTFIWPCTCACKHKHILLFST